MKVKGLIISLALLLALSGEAGWMSQTISLRAGSNLVHLKVNPADTLCTTVFGGTPAITEVTWWNRDRRDDGSGIAPSTDMLVWNPSDASACTFNRVIGGYCYMIQSAANTTLTVVGTPARPRPTLWQGELNLVGLNAPAGGGFNYADYFCGYRDHVATGNIFAEMPNESTLPLPPTTTITDPNTAVWILPSGTGTGSYMGALEMTTDSADEILDYTEVNYPRTITIKNVGGNDRALRFELEQSLAPPAGQGTKAGDVALMQEVINWSVGYPKREYVPVTFPIVTNIAAGATFKLTLRPNLDVMVDTDAGDYLGIIKINDAGSVIAGSTLTNGTCEHRIGVKVGGHLAAPKNTPSGLWVGSVALTGVNRADQFSSAGSVWDSSIVQPATQPFTFRLLVHVDYNGKATLLKEAYIATSSTEDTEAVIYTSRAAAINHRSRHPEAKIRRVSSANFPNYGRPIAFTNAVAGTVTGFARGGTELTASVFQDYDDRVNPFVHAYHPQHDNLHFDNKKMHRYRRTDDDNGTGTFESWTINRRITMNFAETDPNGSNYDWNTTVTGGAYRETFDGGGLTKTTLLVEGTFRLTKVLDTPFLTEL